MQANPALVLEVERYFSVFVRDGHQLTREEEGGVRIDSRDSRDSEGAERGAGRGSEDVALLRQHAVSPVPAVLRVYE